MSAIGMPAPRGKGFTLSALADVRHEHLCFERQQSLTLRQMEWEDRAKPLTPWSTLIVRGLSMAAMAAVLLVFVI